MSGSNMLRSIPPITALGRPRREVNGRRATLHIGQYVRMPKRVVASVPFEVKPHQLRKRLPKVVVKVEKGDIEVHDNGDHIDLISNGEPKEDVLSDILSQIPFTKIVETVIKNGIWMIRLGK